MANVKFGACGSTSRARPGGDFVDGTQTRGNVLARAQVRRRAARQSFTVINFEHVVAQIKRFGIATNPDSLFQIFTRETDVEANKVIDIFAKNQKLKYSITF